jgi:hypothetical protein
MSIMLLLLAEVVCCSSRRQVGYGGEGFGRDGYRGIMLIRVGLGGGI